MRSLEHFRRSFGIRNMLSFVRHLLSTIVFGYASKELADARNSICMSCEYCDKEEIVCNLCGCGLESGVEGRDRFAEKVYHKRASCDLKKW